MTDIDFNLLRSNAGGDPEPGLHTANLVRLALVDTSKGSMLVSEWQTDSPAHYWTAWFGFTPERIGWTNDFLDGLGVDRSKLTDERALEEELERVEGLDYEVRVEQNGRYINTFVEGTADTAQQRLDVPIDTEGLPDVSEPPPPAEDPVAVGGGDFADDEPIPF